IKAVDTHEISHMLFGASSRFSSWLATHPPIEQRIRRIDPQWDGRVERPKRAVEATPQAAAAPQRDARQIFANVGVLTAAALAEARHRLRALPPDLHETAHSTQGSCMLVFALLVASSDAESRKTQVQYLQARLEGAQWDDFVRVLGGV